MLDSFMKGLLSGPAIYAWTIISITLLGYTIIFLWIKDFAAAGYFVFMTFGTTLMVIDMWSVKITGKYPGFVKRFIKKLLDY